MRPIGKIIGYLMAIGAGILMFLSWVAAMGKWLGLSGTILAFVLSPLVAIFPIIFWIVEGVFPGLYFKVWVTGIVGAIIAGLSSVGEDEAKKFIFFMKVKIISGILIGLLVIHLTVTFGWNLLNMQSCTSDLHENPTCEQIAENNAKNCKYTILRWKKIDYNKELRECQQWEQKQKK